MSYWILQSFLIQKAICLKGGLRTRAHLESILKNTLLRSVKERGCVQESSQLTPAHSFNFWHKLRIAYAEIYLAIAMVFRRFDVQLYDTIKERDVDVHRDCFLGEADPTSLGVRIQVVGEWKHWLYFLCIVMRKVLLGVAGSKHSNQSASFSYSRLRTFFIVEFFRIRSLNTNLQMINYLSQSLSALIFSSEKTSVPLLTKWYNTCTTLD